MRKHPMVDVKGKSMKAAELALFQKDGWSKIAISLIDLCELARPFPAAIPVLPEEFDVVCGTHLSQNRRKMGHPHS
jgi:hypothetical protein